MFVELAATRQSCRNFISKPVPRELIDKCLESARLAPSACNSQPWRFLVTDEEPLRSKLAEAAFGGIYGMNKFAGSAGALITVVTERSKYVARLGGLLRGVQYSLIDLGIACQHFDLQAAELGLGCCWLGWFDEKKVKKTLGLPRSDRLDIMLCLGYPGSEVVRPKKRKSLDEIRSFLNE